MTASCPITSAARARWFYGGLGSTWKRPRIRAIRGSIRSCRQSSKPRRAGAKPFRLAHLTFYDGSQSGEYRGDIFAAFHGSWNKSASDGYKIVRAVSLDKSSGKARAITKTSSPASSAGRQRLGRPVGNHHAQDGSLSSVKMERHDLAGQLRRKVKSVIAVISTERSRSRGPVSDRAISRGSRLRSLLSDDKHLHHQLRRKECSGNKLRPFHPQNDRSERDRTATLTAREREFCWSKSPSDQPASDARGPMPCSTAYSARIFFEMHRVGWSEPI